MIQHTNPQASVKIGQRINFVAKTANYTVTQGESGTHFSNTGASAVVVFTLPALLSGVEYWFHSAVLAQDLVVSSPGADTMVVFNDIAADQVAFNQTSERAGGTFHVTCDGTLWYVSELDHDAQSIGIATA